MSMLTVRNLSPETHRLLKQRAATHGRSMEAEARAILDAGVVTETEAPDVIGGLIELGRKLQLTDDEHAVLFSHERSMPRGVDLGPDE